MPLFSPHWYILQHFSVLMGLYSVFIYLLQSMYTFISAVENDSNVEFTLFTWCQQISKITFHHSWWFSNRLSFVISYERSVTALMYGCFIHFYSDESQNEYTGPKRFYYLLLSHFFFVFSPAIFSGNMTLKILHV